MSQNKNEAFSRVLIDAMLTAQGWNVTDPNAVRFEVVMPDSTRADYVLCDRNGRSLAVIEAKRHSVNPADAAEQAKGYAKHLDVPYVFLTNGAEVLFWEWQREAYPHPVKTFFKQDDLERRFASLTLRKDVLNVPIDVKIAGRDYQQDCIQTVSREIKQGRRKLLIEMATGTGKTRTAAALIKRLFEANVITRVLFLVDRIPLAKQTEDAFAEHLPDYPAYVLRAGRRFQDEKRITITTLQSMINLYGEYSSGYFDLIVSDECHRSIYGKWSGVLKYFDGVQIGLTATPCVATRARVFVDSLTLLVAGAMYPAVTDSQVLDQELPLPPLPEQRRIVDLLSRAEGIVRLRREAEKKAAELIPALFLDMFGDPATNPKGWSESKIGDLTTLVTSGSTPRGGSEVYVDEGPLFIRSQNVLMNHLDLSTAAHITPEINNQMRRTSVAFGDVLLNITGASIGRVAWVEHLDCDANVNQHVCIIRLDPKRTVSCYLSVCLSMPYYQTLINTIQAGASRQALNHVQVRSLVVLSPPMHLQEKFSDRIKGIFSIQEQQSAAAIQAQAAFDSLLAQAFSSEAQAA